MARPSPSRLRFNLFGPGGFVEYIDGGAAGRALNYGWRGKLRAFRGAAVEVRHTRLGDLVTVDVESQPDAPTSESFGVLLPAVSTDDPPQGPAGRVATVAISSTRLETGIDGIPPGGVLDGYDIIQMAGTVAPVEDDLTLACSQWSADRELGEAGLETLSVTATCTFPREGFAVELRREEPVDSTPGHLLLRLRIRAPAGATAAKPTKVAASYEERTGNTYRTVTVLPDGPTLDVGVIFTPLPEPEPGPEDPNFPPPPDPGAPPGR
jgi:hypothetical protein